MKNKIYRVELFIVEMNGGYADIDDVLDTISNSLREATITKIKSETKEIVWEDDNIFNFSDTPMDKLIQYFENIENDEYQTYLKLKDKYES